MFIIQRKIRPELKTTYENNLPKSRRKYIQLNRRREHNYVRGDLGYRNSIVVASLNSVPKIKSKPGEAVSIWKGETGKQTDNVFFATGIKRRRSKVNFAPTWCR
jgi:hypothetical protein